VGVLIYFFFAYILKLEETKMILKKIVHLVPGRWRNEKKENGGI